LTRIVSSFAIVVMILAITAGQGNGWQFSEACLRASLPLWEGVACFIDHGWKGQAGERSLRDLSGVCRAPRWSEVERGIRLELHTLGPSGDLADELGRQLLAKRSQAGHQVLPPIGFSADIVFTARGRQVQQDARVDLSLVFNPAAVCSAGAGRDHGSSRYFNRYQQPGGANMEDFQPTPTRVGSRSPWWPLPPSSRR
jgi:hypothetical protein